MSITKLSPEARKTIQDALTPPQVAPVAAAPVMAQAITTVASFQGGIQGTANPELVALLQAHVQRLTSTTRTQVIPGTPAVPAVKGDKRKGLEAKPAIPAKPDVVLNLPPLITGLDIELVRRFAAVCLAITHGSSTQPVKGRNGPQVASHPTVIPGNGMSCHYRHADGYGVQYSDWTAKRNALIDAGLIVGTPNRGDMGLTERGVRVWTELETFAPANGQLILPRDNSGKVRQPQAPQGAVAVPGAVAVKLS